MAWKKKAPKGKAVTTADVQYIQIEHASQFVTQKYADGWFVASVSPVDGYQVLVVSYQKVFPPPPPVPED
jgi:hypothetical protein